MQHHLTAVLQDFDQFLKLCPLILGVARGDGAFDTMSGVIFEDEPFDAFEGCLDRSGLAQDINAITIIINHTRNSAHLPFDLFQSSQRRVLVCVHLVSVLLIPYGGMGITWEALWQPIMYARPAEEVRLPTSGR